MMRLLCCTILWLGTFALVLSAPAPPPRPAPRVIDFRGEWIAVVQYPDWVGARVSYYCVFWRDGKCRLVSLDGIFDGWWGSDGRTLCVEITTSSEGLLIWFEVTLDDDMNGRAIGRGPMGGLKLKMRRIPYQESCYPRG